MSFNPDIRCERCPGREDLCDGMSRFLDGAVADLESHATTRVLSGKIAYLEGFLVGLEDEISGSDREKLSLVMSTLDGFGCELDVYDANEKFGIVREEE